VLFFLLVSYVWSMFSYFLTSKIPIFLFFKAIKWLGGMIVSNLIWLISFCCTFWNVITVANNSVVLTFCFLIEFINVVCVTVLAAILWTYCTSFSLCSVQILQPPAGYVPIRTPARKLTATPTPMAGTPMGFRMQTPDSKTQIVDLQPKGNLPMMKPDDMQYFDKLLVDVDEDSLSPEEQKERKIMKLLLKIKNGTPPMRKVGGEWHSDNVILLIFSIYLLYYCMYSVVNAHLVWNLDWCW